jgi:hypothetical protein
MPTLPTNEHLLHTMHSAKLHHIELPALQPTRHAGSQCTKQHRHTKQAGDQGSAIVMVMVMAQILEGHVWRKTLGIQIKITGAMLMAARF